MVWVNPGMACMASLPPLLLFESRCSTGESLLPCAQVGAAWERAATGLKGLRVCVCWPWQASWWVASCVVLFTSYIMVQLEALEHLAPFGCMGTRLLGTVLMALPCRFSTGAGHGERG